MTFTTKRRQAPQIVDGAIRVEADFGRACLFQLRYRAKDGALIRYRIGRYADSQGEQSCHVTDSWLADMRVDEMIARQALS
jgi:hypothetical protein